MLIVLPMLRSGRTATTLQPDYTTAGQLREADVVQRINHADISLLTERLLQYIAE